MDEDVDILLQRVASAVEASSRAQLEMLEALRLACNRRGGHALATAEWRLSPGPDQATDGDLPMQAAFTVKETTELLGLSENSVYGLIHRGEIPSLRLGRRIVVPRRGPAALFSGKYPGSQF